MLTFTHNIYIVLFQANEFWEEVSWLILKCHWTAPPWGREQRTAEAEAQGEGSSGSRVWGCSVAQGAPTLGCYHVVSRMRWDGEGCGRCVHCSLHVTQSVWWEWLGGTATGRRRGHVREEQEGKEVVEDRVMNKALTVWQTDWCLCASAAGVCVCLVRRSSHSFSSCWVLHATCIRSLWAPVRRNTCFLFLFHLKFTIQ